MKPAELSTKISDIQIYKVCGLKKEYKNCIYSFKTAKLPESPV